jgi:MSHA pilin protein MshD
MSITNRHTGFTLIELAAFIMIVSVAVGGVLLSYHSAARDSADPVIQKQALAIAQSILEEVQQMPFTFCDPDDPAAPTATSTASCATVEAIGPEPGESRYSTTTPFDNVNDYHGYTTATETPSGIKDITGAPISGLSTYDASVTVVATALSGVPAGEALLITVSVSGPRNVSVRLDAYRTRYAPRL